MFVLFFKVKRGYQNMVALTAIQISADEEIRFHKQNSKKLMRFDQFTVSFAYK
jgi:hypothetical protein